MKTMKKLTADLLALVTAVLLPVFARADLIAPPYPPEPLPPVPEPQPVPQPQPDVLPVLVAAVVIVAAAVLLWIALRRQRAKRAA